MPIVHREDGFRIAIYFGPREHGPPHVYVYRAGYRVVINIGTIFELPSVRGPSEMRSADIASAIRIVAANRAKLINKWRECHEPPTAN